MCDCVVVYLSLVIWAVVQRGLGTERCFTGWSFFCLVRSPLRNGSAFTLLGDYSLCERVQIRIGLSEQMGDSRVFGGVDQFHVCFFIVRLKRFQTLLRNSLNPLLFLLLRERVE